MQLPHVLVGSARAATVVLFVGAAAGLAGACSADTAGSGEGTLHSCSPNYTDENKLGRLSVQQKGPGATIQWGAFPKLPADRYVVTIYIGRTKVDNKHQSYQPHGSIPPRAWNERKKQVVPTYRSGQVFKLTGTSYNAKGDVVQEFYIKCRLA